jgi:hypothetical protein
MKLTEAKSLKRNDKVLLLIGKDSTPILARVEDDLCAVAPEMPDFIAVQVRRVNSRGEAFGERVQWPSALIKAA